MHPLYREDNAQVYYCLEKTVRGTQYASTLKSFQRVKNGRGALSLVIQQFARAVKWQAKLSMRDKFLHEKVWNGQTLYPLERFKTGVNLWYHTSKEYQALTQSQKDEL
eukprot:6057812-Ditylum_brightwellii.AAC.1